MNSSWKEVESGYVENTAIAAAATEQIVADTSRVTRGFNRLEILNNDAVAIKVILDGGDQTSGSSRVFQIPSKASFTLEPDEGIWFKQIVQQNIDAAAAEVAGAITFRFASCVRY